ncbi:16S rRNA (cytosine(1402)-N(4))-methyltransferase RsmH [Helicobacter saguini]|uniref:Ribosomal RNA small subunit methyltransferase H n=1 Tax=Helicobacter saguini TaxID=1548018 RepID=A0A347VP44_9HELI|nr:16S rRNA (cytosine(1402)-N(4))-methyltransferase RsmH [Helicobacter saguini]MWV61518.1 16S rRNA (cytosine(1402)-N(4))-methyltransferase RsmH [Helicobacter saguini]MWV67812.1 16S rRNA (cytosine(1402)-N(4))-methyltransferase RsmH [Helicobacter saguini]MWV70720.1 16S rRNA (cytosine(1402)-N(4))-methyltransferase RsmH [Helicobacter saguini]MWV72623.1 16S rRNA (cytosine(1402)-N(4))-methyltransferase RsmH [Helicobacter saguini]TLD94568.1 16S rRNA (cytosine(1402)-N(4))-methyltransferase RsmH [Helic
MIKDSNSPHIPVLLNEVLETFNRILNSKNPNFLGDKVIESNNQFPLIIDCTLGYGGHSRKLLQSYPRLKIIGIDRDLDSIKYNENLCDEFNDRIYIVKGAFGEMLPLILNEFLRPKSSNISNIIESSFLENVKLVGILADIGVSSLQFDNINRGFSFNSIALDMRMDVSQNLSANEILNTYNRLELEKIFSEYGEIKEYKKLVNLILLERENLRKNSKNPNFSSEILHAIALKLNHKKSIHPLTLIYQALRIAVNDELGELKRLLKACENLANCLLCVISFHSLEDRIIKETFKIWAKNCVCDENVMKCECGNNHAKGQILYKKPLVASASEIKSNPRSRSAKLRAFYFFKD